MHAGFTDARQFVIPTETELEHISRSLFISLQHGHTPKKPGAAATCGSVYTETLSARSCAATLSGNKSRQPPLVRGTSPAGFQRGEGAGRRVGNQNMAAAGEKECDGNLIFSFHICFLPFSAHPLTRASFRSQRIDLFCF